MVYVSQYRAILLAILLTGVGLLAATEPAKAAGHLVPTSPTADCPGSPVSVSDFTEWKSAITSFNGVTAASAPCVFNIAVTSNFLVTNGNTVINNANAGVELRVDGADPAISKTSFAISGNGKWLPILIASNTTVTFEHLIIDDGGGQTAIPTNANGGCIFNFGVLTLINSQVTGCQMAFAGARPADGNNGAGIYNNGTLTLIKSTVYNNRAGRGLEARGNGGGIYNTASGTLSIVNSTISGNYAGNNGGGIWSGGTATLLHTTVTLNERNGGSGSGVYVNGGTTTLTNSLIAGQTGTTGTEDCGVNSGATLTSGDYNLDSDDTCQLTATNDIAGSAAANLDSTLNVNGGWTPNYALLNGSAAIDQIPVSGNSCNGTGVVEDQREQVRPSNNLCEIGAYEGPNFGNIIIKKITNPSGGAGFGFSHTIGTGGSFTLDDGGEESFTGVAPGTYTVTEDDPSGVGINGYRLIDLVCVDDNPNGTASTVDVGDREATIELDENETVTCTFTNEDVALPVTLGWFLAEVAGDGVNFLWQTATEAGTAGFNLLAVTDVGLVQLNDRLIPSKVIDSVTPTDYAFSAATDASSFLLQEVTVEGVLNDEGPFELGVEYGTYTNLDTSKVTLKVWLPLVVR